MMTWCLESRKKRRDKNKSVERQSKNWDAEEVEKGRNVSKVGADVIVCWLSLPS